MRASIHAVPSGDRVLIGSDKIQAATHEFGRGSIPARPFLKPTDDQVRSFGQIAADYLNLS